jgi:adenosine deaminase
MNSKKRPWISTPRSGPVFLVLFALLTGCSGIQTARQADTTDYLEQIRNDPKRLHAFVQEMPKGADLHTHLSGVPSAESYLKWAAEDGMCINTTTWVIGPAPCVSLNRPVADTLADSHLYNQAIDGLSMRGFSFTAPRFGHDHFFKAFSLFGDVSDSHKGQMLAEAARRAATDNTDYLELMITLQSDPLSEQAARMSWSGNMETDYINLLTGLRGLVTEGKTELDQIISEERKLMSCEGAAPEPACRVTLRFIQQANRVSSHQKVFASLILGAEMAMQDPRVVGIDLVAPEDAVPALANYALHMQMVAFLKQHYPSLKISLHAGELTANLVAPEHLTSHINQAVTIAGAHRIGHGVDLKSEDGWQDLLATMTSKRIGVAILLTSNDQILGVSGKDHTFLAYLDAGVPVMLATDDQGISRGSHTAEFERAITTYGLHWAQVKQLIRTSMDQAFIQGKGLWQIPGEYSHMVEACATDLPSNDVISTSCKTYLRTNDKASEQWRLEKRLAAFESCVWQYVNRGQTMTINQVSEN